jgi:antitoxin component YwqK of YwqJK toxin-antitoxin module
MSAINEATPSCGWTQSFSDANPLSNKATPFRAALPLSKINYKEYPEFMFAMIAAFLPEHEAYNLRQATGNVVFKHKDKHGNTYKNGLLHSFNDEPAIINDIYKLWYKDGKIHRENDLSALVNLEQSIQKWYKNGKIHREGDLPAVINVKCDLQWWCKYEKLHREADLPAVIESNTRQWYKDGKLHRDNDLPAYISNIITLNYQVWYKNGKIHREGNNPAIIDRNRNHQEWWKNGFNIHKINRK